MYKLLLLHYIKFINSSLIEIRMKKLKCHVVFPYCRTGKDTFRAYDGWFAHVGHTYSV